MKWFIKCFKQYADFSGRARRKEYWFFALFNVIITLILSIGWIGQFGNALMSDPDEVSVAMLSALGSPFFIIMLVYSLVIFIPGLAVCVRRLHDIGRSGYWLLGYYGANIVFSMIDTISHNTVVTLIANLITVALSIMFIVWMFKDSEYGTNQYGPNPKGEGEEVTENETNE